MSTEHQQYSPENQLDIIRQTWRSSGSIPTMVRGGLNIVGREGPLNRLMTDVEATQ